ncbi:MFS general substrate transporter [Penicillium verhagenii]|uniref:MFS general substrate transporter n=1 Tax=Penicillium verhagenii TaxID=1562060 RepID=UPI0025457203|nr:MFS general substrate transporter [Penicillium verhagenii]KAJ5947533.1 MFS general substrate transporter [Penicillium verhagenii]
MLNQGSAQEELIVADPHNNLPPPVSPPDGGLVAWLQVAGSWCLMFNCWGVVNSYGVFQTYYENEILSDHSSSDIAWIGSIQACLLLFIGAITGPLYDYGYFRHLLAAGTFLIVFGMMMVSICTEFSHFVLAQGIVVGLGAGCLFIPSVAVLPLYFRSHLAFSIGVAGSGSGVGGIVYSITFQQLQTTIGFGWASRIVGFISLATLVFPLLFMRVKSATPDQPRKVRKLFDSTTLTETPFCLFLAWGFFGFVGVYMPLYYVGSYALEKEMSSPAVGYLIPILNAGSVLGRIVPNYAADKTGPINMFIPTCFGLAVLSFAWIGISNTPGLIVFVVLYGVFIGTYMTLPFSAVIKLSPHLGVTGVRMGMLCVICSFGVLVGAPVGGAVLHKGGWVGLQSFGGAMLIISTIFILATRIAKVGIDPRKII